MPAVKRVVRDPDEVVHLQVLPGRTVVLHRGLSYGDHATLQAAWRDAEPLLAAGAVEIVDPTNLPDVAVRPAA